MNTILLVEDDMSTVKLLKMVLTRLGNFEVIVSEDVEEILKLTESNGVDLVLMDISLERCQYQGRSMDGIEITKLIKSNPNSEKIPVILASAHLIGSYVKETVKDAGADDYVSKPITDLPSFLNKIKSKIPQQ